MRSNPNSLLMVGPHPRQWIIFVIPYSFTTYTIVSIGSFSSSYFWVFNTVLFPRSSHKNTYPNIPLLFGCSIRVGQSSLMLRIVRGTLKYPRESYADTILGSAYWLLVKYTDEFWKDFDWYSIPLLSNYWNMTSLWSFESERSPAKFIYSLYLSKN